MATNRVDDPEQTPPPPAGEAAGAAGPQLPPPAGAAAAPPAPAPVNNEPPPPAPPAAADAAVAAATAKKAEEAKKVAAESPGNPDGLPAASGTVKLITWIIVGTYSAAAAVALVFLIASKVGDGKVGFVTGRWGALFFGLIAVTLGLFLIQVINQNAASGAGYGIFRPLIGKDRRFSTSLTQVALWTVATCTGFAYLLGRVMFNKATFDSVIPTARWDEYLILLGGPFAAAVLAKGITTYKLDQGTLQKSEPATTTPLQVVQGDDGTADLVDAQYLLFNVVALAYFVVQLCATSKLPEIPPPLLALTGATAAAFVGNKAAQRNAPTVTSVSPSTVEQGGTITIYGTNFDPGDKKDSLRRVTLTISGSTDIIVASAWSDTSATFPVPWSAQPGHQAVKLTTTAGVQSEPHDIEVRAKVATVTGIEAPGAIRPGSYADVTGSNLGKAGERVGVTVDAMLADGTPALDGSRLRFMVPSYLPNVAAASVQVTLKVPGQADVTVTAPVEQPRDLGAWREDDHVEIRAAGLARGADFVPRVLINARSSGAVRALGNDKFSVEVPSGIDFKDAINVVVFDDLERRTAEYSLGPTAP